MSWDWPSGWPCPQLAAAMLTSGERTRKQTLAKDGNSYIVPLRDKTWDDESLIVYQFAEDAPPAAPQKEEGAAAP